MLDAGDYVEAIIDTADPDAKPIPRPDVRRMLVPIGPVAVFGASNFPLAFCTAGGDTASALAAGCPVVVKGHPSHPGTGELVARELRAAVAEAGLPDGTFAHLLAAGVEVGEALVDAPAIAAVGFTGSTAGGRAITDRAARRPQPIPVYAEMGSINPIVVTDAALAARARRDRRRPRRVRRRTSAASCARSRASSSSPAARRATRSPQAVAARLDAVEPTVLLNERLRDALDAAVERLAEQPTASRPLGAAPAVQRRRLPPPARRLRGAGRRGRGGLAAARGALRAGRAAAPLRRPRRAARRARPDRGAAHRHGPREPDDDAELLGLLTDLLAARAGRVLYGGFPTGVAVTHGMHHGGPYPAASAAATRRWA